MSSAWRVPAPMRSLLARQSPRQPIPRTLCENYQLCLESPVSAEIKFCGLTRPEDADFAASLGASYIGVIFAGGPRALNIPRAMEVLGAAPATVARVG